MIVFLISLLLTNVSRAKIKMLAKKSIETGEGCDSIPESMRHYLAMQFDPNKPGARDPFGRAGAYGPPSMYTNETNPSGKVGRFWLSSDLVACVQLADFTSDFSLHLSFPDCRQLAAHWTKCHGLGCFLFPRQGLHDLLYQQRCCRL